MNVQWAIYVKRHLVDAWIKLYEKTKKIEKEIFAYANSFVIIHGLLKHYLKVNEKELSEKEIKLIKSIMNVIEQNIDHLKYLYRNTKNIEEDILNI